MIYSHLDSLEHQRYEPSQAHYLHSQQYPPFCQDMRKTQILSQTHLKPFCHLSIVDFLLKISSIIICDIWINKYKIFQYFPKIYSTCGNIVKMFTMKNKCYDVTQNFPQSSKISTDSVCMSVFSHV